MRTLLIGVLAATTDANGLACLDSTTAGQPLEQEHTLLNSAKTKTKSAARTDGRCERNTPGQSVDTICGRVKAKKASGEDTGDRPFLYLVKDDEAYVVDGAPGSAAAATAYRNICN
jgi:hypothetical protein